jgi:hypothetical protein
MHNLHSFEFRDRAKLKTAVVFYFNPEGFPEHFAANEPEVLALAGSPELQDAKRREIFIERSAKVGFDEASSVVDSTLVMLYGGETDADCNDDRDGIFVLCVIDDPGYFIYEGKTVSGFGSIGIGYVSSMIHFTVVQDGFIHLNAKYLHNAGPSSTKVLHEALHVADLAHEDEVLAVMNTSIPASLLPLSLQPDDIAGIRHLYPFTEACAPVFDMEGGQLGFWAEIYLPGVLHRVRLNYREPGYLEVVAAPLVDISSQERSCALKLDGDKLFIPFIVLDDETYWLDLELKPIEDGKPIILNIIDYKTVE